MMWLWAVGPLVLLGTAMGLVVAARSLDRVRADVVAERQRTRPDAASELRTALVDLGQDIDTFQAAFPADTTPTVADR